MRQTNVNANMDTITDTDMHMFTLADAAGQLAVHPLTLRRRIKKGTVQSTKKQLGENGYQYLISSEEILRIKAEHNADLVNTQIKNYALNGSSNSDDSKYKCDNGNPAMEGLVELVGQQNETIAELQKELRSVGETAVLFQTKNEMLEQQIQRLLPAPDGHKPRKWYLLWLS